MADGDKSKRLAYRVLEIMDDQQMKIFKTIKSIYDIANEIQSEWMRTYKTTKQTFEISLSAVGEYTIDPRVQKEGIINHYDNLNYKYLSEVEDSSIADNTGVCFYCDWARYKYIVISIADDVTKMYVEAFIKPATHEDTGTPVSDNICDTYDPIIGDDYIDLMIKAIIAEKKQDYKTREYINEKARVKSNN